MSTNETRGITGTEDKLFKLLERQLEMTNYWLSFAEGKNLALLAVNGVIITAIFAGSDKIPLSIGAVIICSIIASCIFCLRALYPNMKSNDSSNLLYYLNISKIKEDTDYVDLVKKKYFAECSDVEYNVLKKDMAEEIVINSEIAVCKYQYFKLAVIIDGIALLVTGAVLLLNEYLG